MAEDGEIPTLPEAEAAGGEPAPAAEPDVNAASGVDWESRANDLQAKVAEMTEELESVKSSFAQEEAETKRLTEEVAEKDKQIEQLSGDRDQDLGDMLDDLRRDLDQQNDDLEQLRRDLRDKEDEMRSEQDATRRAQEDLIRERENTERFQKDRQRDKQEIERLQGKISDMRGTADKLKRDQFKVKKQAEERNRKADQFLDEIAELTKRDKELQEKADEAVMQLNEVLAELEEVQEKFDTADADRKRMLQEMAGAESERADFESRIAEGEESYNALQDEMDAMAEDYQARLNEMTDAYEEAKDGLDKTSAENELLQNEIDQLKDESALGIVQTKLEQAEKEQEELRAANQDMDAELTEVIDERDTIKVELRELKRDAKKNLEDAVGEERGKTEDAKAELADVTQQLALTRKRYDTLDDTVADKDSEIFRIQTRMDEMEQAVWGLPEAVKEVKILTARVSTRDKELKETKALLNDRVRQLDDIRLETTELRRRLGKFTEAAGEDDEGQAAPLFDLKLLKLKEQAEMERLRALNEILTTENEQLEEERLELKTKLRFSASQRAQFALSMGLTSEQYSFLESVAERMREDGVPDMPLNDRSRDLEEQLQRRDDQIADLQERLGASDEYGDEVKESLEQMRNVIEGLFKENRELRSANLRFQPHSSVAGAAPAVGAPAQPPPAQIVYQQTTFAAAPSAAAAEPPATTPSKAAVAAAPLSVDIPAGKGAGDTTRSPTPEDDDDQQQEEETQQAGFSSGPGTPLQRQVLRILGDAGLRSSLGMQPAASGPQAHENQKLREANARLLENALESSASADTGALKARAEKAELEASKLRKKLTQLKRELRKADLGVPWVPPMPSEAMQDLNTEIVVEAAQKLRTPQVAGGPEPEPEPEEEAKLVTPEDSGETAAAVPPTPRGPGGEATYAEDYVDLQTQLIEALAEIEEKEGLLGDMEKVLATHEQEMTTALDRQALLYREHARVNTDWKERAREQNHELQKLQTELDAAKLQLERYSDLDALVEEAKQGLGEDSDIVTRLKAQAMEMTRKATVLEVQEMLSRRKAGFSAESEKLVRRQYNAVRADQAAMERSLREKIVHLEQSRMESENKLAQAQAEAKVSIPKEDHDKLRSAHGSLMRRHQELMLTHSNSSTQMLELKSLRTQIMSLRTEVDVAHTDLAVEKLKSAKAEALVQRLESGEETLDLIQLQRKVDTQEMQLKSFESRATNAERRADAHQKAEEAQTERVEQLEAQTKELSERLRVERDETDNLRREVERSITVERSLVLENQVTRADGAIASLKVERDKYKEIAAIASRQATTIQNFARADSTVADGLRAAVADLQSEDDKNNIIAKLHMQVINARLVEVRTQEKGDEERQQLKHLIARELELEEEADLLRSKLLRAHAENTRRERALENRLWEARDALAGSVKIEQQEKTIAMSTRLQSVNADLERQNRKLTERKIDLEVQLKAIEMEREQGTQLQKIEAQPRSIEGNVVRDAALREMSEKVLKLRVSEARLQRVLKNVAEQENHFSTLAAELEETLRNVEERGIKSEVQAEHKMEVMEQEMHTLRAELFRATEENKSLKLKSGFGGGSGSGASSSAGGGGDGGNGRGSPPPGTPRRKPPAEIQDDGTESDRTMVLKLREQLAELNAENSELADELQQSQANCNARDIRIEGLEQSLDEARASVRAAHTSALRQSDGGEDIRETEDRELLRSAQEMIERLHAERSRKDEDIVRMQQMMHDVRERAVEERGQLEQEISHLSAKLYATKTDDVAKLRSAMQQLERGEVITQVYYDKQTGATNWMKQAREWEETLTEKDAMNENLRSQVVKADLQVEKAREAERAKDTEVKKLMDQVEELKHRKPSDKLKKLVKTLKQQLMTKEKQLKNLQMAIETLRADVEASGVRAQASAGSSGGPQVEELLEKQTKFVQRLQRTKAEIQTLKDNEAKLKAELDICRPAAETLQLERQRSNKLQADVARLKRTAKSAAPQAAPQTDTSDAEERLQAEIDALQTENSKLRSAAASPGAAAPTSSSGGGQSLAQWEMEKKLRAKVERLTKKLSERKQELDRVTNDVDEWRARYEKVESEGKARTTKMKELETALAAAATASGPSAEELDKITQSETGKKKLLELDAENRRLNKVINVDNAQAIARLEQQAADYKEQATTLETMLKHSNRQLEQAAAEGGVDRDWLERTNADLREGVMGSTQQQQSLRNQILRMENEALEARFVTEDAKREAATLQTRVVELQALTEYLRRSQAAGTGHTTSAPGRPSRKHREREVELEAVIDKLKRVVEKTQVENEHLRKTGTTNSRYMELTRDNRMLKKKRAELEAKQSELLAKLVKEEEAAKRGTQAGAAVQSVRRDLKKAQAETQRTREHTAALQLEVDEANARAAEADDALERVRHGTDGALGQLREENERLGREADNSRREAAKLSSQLDESVRYQEELRGRLGGGDDESVGGAAAGRVAELEAEVATLSKALQSGESPEMAQLLEKEKARATQLAAEVDAMRKDLSAFDPAFFEELEDLKYDFEQAKARNTTYETQLRQLSQQAGVAWEPAP